MSSFYGEKDCSELVGLAGDLSQVTCPDELEFDYLFDYEPPCSEISSGEPKGWLSLSRFTLIS